MEVVNQKPTLSASIVGNMGGNKQPSELIVFFHERLCFPLIKWFPGLRAR